MTREGKFISLQKASDTAVKYNLTLPSYIDQGKIGVNKRGVFLLKSYAGIENLNITTCSDKDMLNNQSNITKINESVMLQDEKTDIPREITLFDVQITKRHGDFFSLA